MHEASIYQYHFLGQFLVLFTSNSYHVKDFCYVQWWDNVVYVYNDNDSIHRIVADFTIYRSWSKLHAEVVVPPSACQTFQEDFHAI